MGGPAGVQRGRRRRGHGWPGPLEAGTTQAGPQAATTACSRDDAAVALPGGLGTLDEVVELLLWTQLGIHQLPLVLLDVATFWNKFIEFLDEAVSYGLLNREFRNSLERVTDPSLVIEVLGRLTKSRT